ncbi:MFS transporter [Phyllobacterium phragmitis]|uniref:MFS transporter n=1 Tax=Phyllobacterium phragmitis TaxID=2670329 RepID=A0A2S9IT98_9HYPH|nr:MFS transporter [Phyllobacterium phragmitis]PRD43738.1 MFS transporter [Phyllobacterium phragmitis]
MTERPPAPSGLVIAAVVMTMSSAFGQTYFIAIFAPQLKAELGLTDGGFGSLYAIATIASAAILIWGGKIADRYRIRWLAVLAILALAGMCVAMSGVSAAWMLLPVLFGLRLFGQGSMGQLAITGVGRWYHLRRGKMMSLAVLGFPASEAVMPFAAVTMIGAYGWRETWLAAAGILVLVSIPLVVFLLRREPAVAAGEATDASAFEARREWTRAEVIRKPEFFAVVSGIVVPSFAMTGIFFHQAHLVEVKGWSLAWFAGWFPVYAGASVLMALLTGWLVDRYAARRFLPFFLIPMALGISVLAFSSSPYVVPAFMLLCAITNGSASTLLGALWAELFGTRHLGAIRSVAFAGQVFASALAPGLMGLLLDLDVSIETQYSGMVAYAVISAVCLWLLLPRLNRIADDGPTVGHVVVK